MVKPEKMELQWRLKVVSYRVVSTVTAIRIHFGILVVYLMPTKSPDLPSTGARTDFPGFYKGTLIWVPGVP